MYFVHKRIFTKNSNQKDVDEVHNIKRFFIGYVMSDRVCSWDGYMRMQVLT